jgi:nitrite reductase/ring-hydroxylating ferredoxin subunit
MLFDDKVLCPAHAAGFSIVTGEPEYAPGLNGIPTFGVVEGGMPGSKPVPLAKRDLENKTHFVIVGGGAAGLNCAETLR